jgi:predicted dehydrogenase
MQRIFSKDVEDAVYAIFSYADGHSGVLETNWSDETCRKMSTTITLYGTQGKLVADRQELKLYLRPGCAFEKYEEGWSTRYITDLQQPVAYYLRGEEYSAQMDCFIGAIESGNLSHENSFASSCETDRVLELISAADKAGG